MRLESSVARVASRRAREPALHASVRKLAKSVEILTATVGPRLPTASRVWTPTNESLQRNSLLLSSVSAQTAPEATSLLKPASPIHPTGPRPHYLSHSHMELYFTPLASFHVAEQSAASDRRSSRIRGGHCWRASKLVTLGGILIARLAACMSIFPVKPNLTKVLDRPLPISSLRVGSRGGCRDAPVRTSAAKGGAPQASRPDKGGGSSIRASPRAPHP